MVTTRTRPSCPVLTCVILASGHFAGTRPSSCRTTTSPTRAFLVGWCHFANCLRIARYSVDYLCQKWRTRVWHKCHWRRREMERYEKERSGRDSRGRPIKKCPGVNASIPSSSQGKGAKGLLLRHASTWVRMVVNSSKVNLVLAITHLKWVFILLTAASQRPPKWGAHSGIKFHTIFCDEQNSEMIPCVFCC